VTSVKCFIDTNDCKYSSGIPILKPRGMKISLKNPAEREIKREITRKQPLVLVIGGSKLEDSRNWYSTEFKCFTPVKLKASGYNILYMLDSKKSRYLRPFSIKVVQSLLSQVSSYGAIQSLQ